MIELYRLNFSVAIRCRGKRGFSPASAFSGTESPVARDARHCRIFISVRMPQFPDVPTVAQSGLPGFEFNSWFSVMAPAGTPRPIVRTLSAEIGRALADPEVRAKLIAQGLTPRGTTPDELGRAMSAQLARYGQLIKQAGITPE